MKTIIYLTCTLLLGITTINSHSQILADFPCYTVSSGELANVLFEYDPLTNEWVEIGITGGTQIEAIATDPVTGIIYASDAGTFGVIDSNTGIFNPIGEIGTGNGDAGLIELNDVDGLTYDPINQIMYGTHRVPGRGPGTNDLLFQIDVATGKVISGAMIDANNSSAEYSIIPEVFGGTRPFDLYDVADIAYNTYTGHLFALQNQDRFGTITQLNPLNGQIEAVIFDIPDEDVEGLGFTYLGELYGTIGDNGETQLSSNVFIFFDLNGSSTTTLNFIDPTNQHTNFEAFDCFTAYNDLALKMETDSNIQQPVNIGDSVSFLITIYNQGKFFNSDITITNYIPEGLILSDADWKDLGNGTATYLNQWIASGTSVEIPVSFIVDPAFKGASLTNTAEIKSSFNVDITDGLGNPLALSDWDSKPDNENNEENVIDDEINGSGLNAIQNNDEDDHDIAILQVNSLPAVLTINPEFCDALGSAQVEITSNMEPPFTYKWWDANGNLIDENTSLSTVYQLSALASRIYTVIVSNTLNQTSTFKFQIPFLAESGGNLNCDSPCPEYLVVPEGEIYGDFKAEQVIEIQGYVNKSKTALFDICE